MKRRAATWTVFAACVACGIALLAWLTQAMVRLEAAEARARAHAAHEIAIGGALWQMDGWLLPILAEEAQRPVTDYRAFQQVEEAYTSLLNKLSPGEVVTPSPLLSFRSDLFPLHFEVDHQGNVSSPQVPRGNELDVAQSQTAVPHLDDKRALLERVKQLVQRGALATFVANCKVDAVAPTDLAAQQQQRVADDAGANSSYQLRSQATVPARQKVSWLAAGADGAPAAAPVPGAALVPMWLDDPVRGDGLVFVRRVLLGGRPTFQGILADWGKLSAGLLAAITDPGIAHGARLARVDHPKDHQLAHMLTVVPAVLVTTPPRLQMPGWTPGRALLLTAWFALLATGLVVGLTLRAALAFGDRRARFASAVTHELRTPLTTFRMYSEMLASGMVTDPVKQKQYLATLQSESDRLARLVENVLGYARIEDGRFTARIESITLAELIARVRPVLERRAADAGFAFEVAVQDPEGRVDADCDAVGQILFNLVDNACKYGKPPLTLAARADGPRARITLSDRGAGIPTAYRARIFAAFDRGPRQIGDNEVPGVGLGLALARGMARDLRGDLTLEDGAAGATFALALPASPAAS